MFRFVRGNDSSRIAIAFICSPEGQAFEDNLIFNVYPGYFNNHPNSNNVKLFLYNQDTGKWKVENTRQKTGKRLRFEIEHFSRYAIAN